MTALNFDTVANAEDRATVHYTVPKNGTKTSGRMGGLLNSMCFGCEPRELSIKL